MVSADKMPPVEAVKEGHTEKDGDPEVAPSSRDNPTVAQGKGGTCGLGTIIQQALAGVGPE